MPKPLVSIVMGSDSDLPIMEEAARVLKEFKIPHEMVISSAHRSPRRTAQYARTAERRGIKVIIAGAGWAAHLAGVIASETTLPVIGVPLDTSPLKGIDSFFSTLQMPGGVPVATMAIGKAGARNAGILAVQILALKDLSLSKRLRTYKRRMALEVAKKARGLMTTGHRS